MSIEKNIERIADALESLIVIIQRNLEDDPKETQPKKKKAAPKVDPLAIGDPEPTPPAKVYDIKDVQQFLVAYSKKHGEAKAIALMVKHGADKKKPTIKTLPKENYAALIENK